MSRAIDQNTLKHEQYRDASNLNARIALHQRFGASQIDFQAWVLGQFALPPDAHILELGCGPGRLWVQNLDRLPAGWAVTLSDFSQGMVAQARQNLAVSDHPFVFEQFDAQAIPFANGKFDAVIANHMLYHVPDRPKALAEIRRVLRPAGTLFASTLSCRHLGELRQELDRLDPALSFGQLNFNLDTGAAELGAHFRHVTLHRFEDALEITEVEPLLEYVDSGQARTVLANDDQRRQLIAWAEDEIARHGSLHITTDSGLFEAW